MNGGSRGSNGSGFVLRTIIEESSYAFQVDAIEGGRGYLDEHFSDLEFTIARIPELFQVGQGPNGGPICVIDHDGVMPLRIWFTYNENEVHLLGIARK